VRVAVPFHPSDCWSFVFRTSFANLTGMEVKRDTTTKDTRLHPMNFWKAIKRCRVWIRNSKVFVLLLRKVARVLKVFQFPQ